MERPGGPSHFVPARRPRVTGPAEGGLRLGQKRPATVRLDLRYIGLRHASLPRGSEVRGSEYFKFASTCVNQSAPDPLAFGAPSALIESEWLVAPKPVREEAERELGIRWTLHWIKNMGAIPHLSRQAARELFFRLLRKFSRIPKRIHLGERDILRPFSLHGERRLYEGKTAFEFVVG